MYIFFSSIFGVSCGSFVDYFPFPPVSSTTPALLGPPFPHPAQSDQLLGWGAAGGEWCS